MERSTVIRMNEADQTRQREPRWTPEYAQEMLERWQLSGLSLAAFARQEGLPYHRLFHWRKQFVPLSPETTAFVPVRLPSVSPPAECPLEVVLAGGRRVRVAPGFDPAVLRQLIETLEAAAC
jgi:transposase